ncbi:hypothetical protein P8452_13696 [Trifolium repens]|nr:hypothetical protein P8452_13696 [Trifolium repens]
MEKKKMKTTKSNGETKRGGHNASSCKSKVQDPNGLKRKRKPPKAKAPDEAKSGAIPKSDANPSTEANASQQPNSATVEVSQNHYG